MRYKTVPVVLLFLIFIFTASAQDKPVPAAANGGVYLVVFRTPAHVRSSSPQVFHGFAQDLWDLLKSKNVPLKVDPERGTIETESAMSVDSMLNIAGQVGASSLLFVTVDRPVTKWIKVTVQSYGLDRKLQWSEEASDGGSMSGKGGYKKTLERLETSFTKRFGGPGLPTSTLEADAPKPPQGVEKP